MSPNEIEAIVDELVRAPLCPNMVREKVEPLVVKLAGVRQGSDKSTADIKASVFEALCDPKEKWRARSEAELRGWLALDTWTVEEGLLLIAGIDPEAAVLDGRGWVSALGVRIKRVRILNARPLSSHPVFLAIPPPQLPQLSDYQPLAFHSLALDPAANAEDEELKWEKVSILRELEERLNSIVRLWRSGEHDRKRYSVPYFLEWANKHRLDIPWLQEAREKGWLPAQLCASDSVQNSHASGSVPEPAAGQARPVKLINRSEVMACFPVKDDLRENERFWDDKLSTPPEWLEAALVIRGKRGVSHLWNPLEVAHSLLGGVHNRAFMTVNQLDAVMRRRFPELYEAWVEESQDKRV